MTKLKHSHESHPTDIHFRGIYRAFRETAAAANVFADIRFGPVAFRAAFARRVCFAYGSKETRNQGERNSDRGLAPTIRNEEIIGSHGIT